jgi:hypothetical protein
MSFTSAIASVRRGQRGSALLVVVGLLGVLTIIAGAFPGLSAMQSIMARRVLNRMRAGYLARAGVQIALADLSAPGHVKGALADGLLQATHEFPENARVETAVFPAKQLESTILPELLGKPRKARLQAIYDALPVANPETGNPMTSSAQSFRMIIVSQGRVDGVTRLKSMATVAVLTELRPLAAPVIICWLEF